MKCPRSGPVGNRSGPTVAQYATLLMHVPWRSEAELFNLADNDTNIDNAILAAAFQRHSAALEAARSRLPPDHAGRIHEIMERILDDPDAAFIQQQNEWRPAEEHSGEPDVEAQAAAGFDDNDGDEHELAPAAAAQAQAPAPAHWAVPQGEELQAMINQLNGDQRSVLQVIQHYIRAMDDYERACTEYHRTQQENALFPQRAGPALPMPQPPRPPHVFVTGSAGSGKSFLIRAIVGVVHRYAIQRANERPCPTGGTLLMAPTGMAAFNIGGCTIHSALSIKPEKRGHANFAALSKQLLEPLQQHLRNLLCAIVDEVSMLSSRLMVQMNQRLNQIFHTDGFGSDSIFGNKAAFSLETWHSFGLYAPSTSSRSTTEMVSSPTIICTDRISGQCFCARFTDNRANLHS